MCIRIIKVKDDYGWMHCMSPHPIEYEGIKFRTVEALFQWRRFKDHPDVQKEIIEQKSQMAAKMKARKHKDLLKRGDKWDEAPECLARMKECLELKFEQHPELAKQLIATGSAKIIEDCTTHDRESARFWGAVLIKGKWHGENNLGKLSMELRKKLRSSNP